MSEKTQFTLFETAIGVCGVAWDARGVVGAQLPMPNGEKTRLRMLQRFPQGEDASPPASIQRIIDDVVAMMKGEAKEFSNAPLVMDDVPEFNQRVYRIARAIPHGGTLTYGDIAKELGDLALSRMVGQAMGQNPFPPLIPCHRVLGAGGKPGGFSANGGVETKLKMLTIEKAKIAGQPPSLFDDLPLAAKPGRR